MLEMIKIDTIKREIEDYRCDVEKILIYTKKLEVYCKKDAQKAIDIIAKARTIKESIEEKKKEITKGARDFIAKINNLSKEFTEPLDLVEDMIIQKIDHWKIVNAQAQEDEEQDAAELSAFGLDIIPMFDDGCKLRAEHASAYEQISHVFEILEPNEVPREYLMVDEKKVALAMKNGVRVIPGLKISEKVKTIIKRSK